MFNKLRVMLWISGVSLCSSTNSYAQWCLGTDEQLLSIDSKAPAVNAIVIAVSYARDDTVWNDYYRSTGEFPNRKWPDLPEWLTDSFIVPIELGQNGILSSQYAKSISRYYYENFAMPHSPADKLVETPNPDPVNRTEWLTPTTIIDRENNYIVKPFYRENYNPGDNAQALYKIPFKNPTDESNEEFFLVLNLQQTTYCNYNV